MKQYLELCKHVLETGEKRRPHWDRDNQCLWLSDALRFK